MAKKLRVGVIFGGRSGEHEVSIRSAQAIVEAINRKKFDVVPIAISKEGKWLPPAQSIKLLPATVHELVPAPATTTGDVAILGDPSHKGLISGFFICGRREAGCGVPGAARSIWRGRNTSRIT
ncbi:MAG: hypothetical protein DMF69_20445 [Acidobacteria bacterium]|nr:MAG: hypothetical protein DMF69_20445 [Acidobacteriota bacterium]